MSEKNKNSMRGHETDDDKKERKYSRQMLEMQKGRQWVMFDN